MRKLRPCSICGNLGIDLMRLAAPLKRGKPGIHVHGYCYAKDAGMAALAALPYDELVKITLDEMLALGFKGNAGYLRFDQMCKAAAKRSTP
jgi:hypothetical protein